MATTATTTATPGAAYGGDGRKRRKGAEVWARVSYAGHGLAYGLVAVFAIDAAFGGGGERAKGGRGAISEIASSGWGTALLVALTVGLVAYGIMRLWQGFADPGGHGSDAKGFATRGGRVASGVVNLLLGLYASSIAFGWFGGLSGRGGGSGQGGGGGGGSGGASGLTAEVMSWPAGQWIVGIAGVAIAAAGLKQLKHAVSADFMDELSAGAWKRGWVKPTGRAGFAARFVVFGLIGVLIVIAAWQSDPSEAEGLGGALRTLQDQAYGPWLLGVVAIGLLAFAVSRGIFARYMIVPQRD